MQKECMDTIFKNCGEDEIKMIVDFIQVYCKCNGSINKISDLLAVHKNTVQYRINKINELLGTDIRNTKNLLRLFLACFFAAVYGPDIPGPALQENYLPL
jgi:carbohydrate diacid regulator